MKNILYQKVLKLNADWRPIGYCTVKTALEDMNSSDSPKKALKIEYYKDDNGSYHFDMPTEFAALDWKEWAELSPREIDTNCIRTPSLELRVPTVIIAPKYRKLPFKKFRPTRANLYNQYGGICYWTGRKLSYKEMNVEHVISRDEWKKRNLPGSPNTWNNLAPCDSKINHKKGNLPPKEFEKKTGLHPHYKLEEPAPVVGLLNIDSPDANPDWKHFIKS